MKNLLRSLQVMALSIAFILFSGSQLNLNAQQENALNFDGTDDFAAVSGASSSIVGGTGISMSCWVYPTNANSGWPNFDGFCGFRNESTADFYLLQLNSTTVEARFRNSSGTDYTLTYTGLQLNVWQHFVLTYDGSTLSLYKDNVLVTSGSASGSISSGSETFYIGKLPFQSNNFQFKGTLDEVSLWDKALSTSEISALYTCGTQLAASNLKFHFQFNQGNAGGSNTGLTSASNSTGGSSALLQNFALNGTISNWVTGKQIGNYNYLSGAVCQGDSMLFGGQYVSVAGNYSDTIPVAGSCDSIVVLALTVHSGFYDTLNTTICIGDSTLFHGDYYTQSGRYDKVYTSAQCDSVYTLNLTVAPLPAQFTISGAASVIEHDTETYTAPADPNLMYFWFITGGSINSQPNNHTIDVLWGTPGYGSVKALVQNQNYCISDTVTLSVTVGVDGIENSSDRKVSVYPNPASDFVIIECKEHFTAKLFDYTGKYILQTSSRKLDVSELSSGLYTLSIKTKKGRVLNKQILVE